MCADDRRGQIDLSIASGGSLRAVGREYGIPEATLRSHRPHVIRDVEMARAKATAALEMPPAPDGDSPIHRALRELAETHATTLERYGQANVRETAALHLQLRRDLELRARLEAQVQPDTRPPGERLWDNPDYRPALAAIVEALRRHPDALRDVLAEMERIGEAPAA